MTNPIDDAILEGFLERFKDPDGKERIRPTPAGALEMGDVTLAFALRECKAGNHQFLALGRSRITSCVCGEKRA